jgi:hypothetical protein
MEQKLAAEILQARLAMIGRSLVEQRIHSRNRAARNRSILKAVDAALGENPHTFKDLVMQAFTMPMPEVTDADIVAWFK